MLIPDEAWILPWSLQSDKKENYQTWQKSVQMCNRDASKRMHHINDVTYHPHYPSSILVTYMYQTDQDIYSSLLLHHHQKVHWPSCLQGPTHETGINQRTSAAEEISSQRSCEHKIVKAKWGYLLIPGFWWSLPLKLVCQIYVQVGGASRSSITTTTTLIAIMIWYHSIFPGTQSEDAQIPLWYIKIG